MTTHLDILRNLREPHETSRATTESLTTRTSISQSIDIGTTAATPKHTRPLRWRTDVQDTAPHSPCTLRLLIVLSMLTSGPLGPFVLLVLAGVASATSIDRHAIVSRYNPVRTASSNSTPMQVGNGHFAFGADVTGLQTFLPFAIMSDWGWKNDSLPEGTTEADLEAYRGETWDGVTYLFGGPEPLQDWLTANPGRANLGRVGLMFMDDAGKVLDVAEEDVEDTTQTLDLWTGTMTSSFRWQDEEVVIRTVVAQSSDTVGVTIASRLLERGRLGIFLDFPWNENGGRTILGFQAPFVGFWNETSKHTTSLTTGPSFGENIRATIAHTLVNNTFFTVVGGGDPFSIERVSTDEHRYTILPSASSSSFSLAIAYTPDVIKTIPTVSGIKRESEYVWEEYWSKNGFIDLVTGSSDARADELQRRIILSRYLMRVNEAGDTPPQEVRWPHLFHPSTSARSSADCDSIHKAGLVNNGWVSALLGQLRPTAYTHLRPPSTASSTWRCSSGTVRTGRSGTLGTSSTAQVAPTRASCPRPSSARMGRRGMPTERAGPR